MGALAAGATHDLPLAQVTRSPFIASGLEPLASIVLARLLLDGEKGLE